MQTLAFLAFVAWALTRYGVHLLAALRGAAEMGREGVEIAGAVARREAPRLRNTLVAIAGITGVLFSLALGLILWGVQLNEYRLLQESGASREVLDAAFRRGLGAIGSLGSTPKTIGWMLFVVFAVLQVVRAISRPQPLRGHDENDLEWILRLIRHYSGPMLVVLVVFLGLIFTGSFVDFMERVTKEQASYLLASVAVAAGALVFGPWLVLLSRALVVLAWACGIVYDFVGGVLWKVADVFVDFLAAGGLAEKLEPRSKARPRFMSWAEAVSWPWVIFWFVAVTVLMVWPRKVVILAMFPAAVFGWVLYAIMKWRGWEEWFTRVAYFTILLVLIPWWGINLTMPAVAEVPGAWMAEGNTAAHCLMPGTNDKCLAWKMRRAAAGLRKLGELPALPTLPTAPGGARPRDSTDDDSPVDAPPDE